MKTRCASLTHSVIPTRFPMCAPSRTRMKHPQTVTVYPEKNENKAAYLLWRSLRAALLTAGALIALMVIWNVDLKSLFVLPLGGAVTVLLGCIAGDYLGAKNPLPSAFVILRKFRRIDCENRRFRKKSRQIFDDVVYWR
ncbi:hypothetical protein ACTNEV_00740 [Oscillospiraceae bacterium HCP3S3_D12]